MKFLKIIAVGLTAFGLSVGAAKASHTTTGSANYIGELHDGSFFDEVTLTGRVDWYLLPVVSGSSVTITMSRGDTGNLRPNISIFDGVAGPGQTTTDAGLNELFFGGLTNSNSFSAVKSGTFIAPETTTYSLLLTTWTNQRGTYDLSCQGCAPEISTVPLPAALPLMGAVLGLFGFLGFRRRRQMA